MIEFQWDQRKALSNKKKHGVSFDEAETVFYDENARVMHDPAHSQVEDRFVILGHSSFSRVLVVCHCCREKDSVIRIISARKATRTEIKQYAGYLS